jgi:AraC-like DNA-binding protein
LVWDFRNQTALSEPVAATFFCGAYRFEGDLCQSLLQALPEMLPLRRVAGSTLRATMDLLAGAMLRDDPGQQTLLDRLLDVALVQILREHFTSSTATAPGWFRASGDARIGPALQALHANPGHPWTVAELAALGYASEFSFAAAFKRHHGTAPGRWRHETRDHRLAPASAPMTS